VAALEQVGEEGVRALGEVAGGASVAMNLLPLLCRSASLPKKAGLGSTSASGNAQLTPDE